MVNRGQYIKIYNCINGKSEIVLALSSCYVNGEKSIVQILFIDGTIKTACYNYTFKKWVLELNDASINLTTS